MNPMHPILLDMNTRLLSVENRLLALGHEVKESSARQGNILDEMKAHADAMRREAEAMRREAEAMQNDSATMHREVSRNAANFDQAVTQMAEDLGHFRSSVGTVVSWLAEGRSEHETEHAELKRRLEDVERKQAG